MLYLAGKLVNPAVAAGYDLSSVGDSTENQLKPKPDRLRTAAIATQGKMEKFFTSVAVVTKLKQDGSEVSLGSFFDQVREKLFLSCRQFAARTGDCLGLNLHQWYLTAIWPISGWWGTFESLRHLQETTGSMGCPSWVEDFHTNYCSVLWSEWAEPATILPALIK